jgi:hypothetical protein
MFASLLTHMHHILCLLIPTTTATAFLFAAGNPGDVVVIQLYSLHEGTLNNARGRRRCALLHEVRPTPRDAQIAEDDVKSLYPTVRQAFTIPGNDDDEGTRPCTMVVNIQQRLFGCSRLGAMVWLSSIALAALLSHPYNNDPLSMRVL